MTLMSVVCSCLWLDADLVPTVWHHEPGSYAARIGLHDPAARLSLHDG